MNPWFIWKGKNSLADFGLWINKLPRRVRAEERHEEIEIPGRAGSLLMLEGEDVYSSYTAEMTVIARNTINIDRIIEWLRGSSDLILSTDINKARSARIVGEVAFERVGNNLQQAVIPFLFQPFRKSVMPDKDHFQITQSGTIRNLGDVRSFPKMTINAIGSNQVMSFSLNDLVFTVDFTGIADTSCVVDSETEMVLNYAGSAELTSKSDGEFPYFKPGDNALTLISGITSIDVDPNWRWL